MINWYIVQTFSGFEQKVAGTIKETIQKKELNDKISEVLVPTHEVTLVKKGKRVNHFHISFLAGAEGIEPPTSGFGDRRSTN